MENVLLVIVGLLCLPLSALGLRSLFAPTKMAADMSITPEGPAGLNTVRGVMGGLFSSCVAMLILGLTTGERAWFMAVALVMAGVLFGRFVGIARDGLDKAVVPPIIVELVIGTVLVVASL